MTRRPPPDPKVGKLLAGARDRAGLSQREVSSSSGGLVSPALLSRVESGQRSPGIGTLLGISRTLPIELSIRGGVAWLRAVDSGEILTLDFLATPTKGTA